MSYTHKSGAQKRKEKERREKEAAKGQVALSRYLKLSNSQDTAFLELSSQSVPSTSTSHEIIVDTGIIDSVDSGGIASHLERDVSEPSPQRLQILNSSSTLPLVEECFDIGSNTFNVDTDIKKPHERMPECFPEDETGRVLPISIFKKKLVNGETVSRDWLVWSRAKEALYCVPCRIFSNLPQTQKSVLASADGYSASRKWKKLHDKIPEHENTVSHKNCYVLWKTEQRKSRTATSLNDLLLKSIQHEQEIWKDILRRLFHVTLFLAERGLAFRGDSNKIDHPSNGNFLGILELLAKYDPLLNDHLRKVRHSQEAGTRLQVHYLSADIQNEFISICAAEVTKRIIHERENAKYFALIVDATPDSAHIEQTAFLIRYVSLTKESEEPYEIKERLLAFVDCAQKTGMAIAQLIKSQLDLYKIPLADCRGQGYDNGSNMKGAYKGVQAHILAANSLAIYSPCANHSLNLSGVKAAESCPAAITFFGFIQKLYNLFSSSPQRWDILKKKNRSFFAFNLPN